ncbi:transmembrane amino acid transporter protein-domain-containing protein [Fomitopsis serialis]|uniref:transmembrane amino acid transporter protein-domain-containing protein n=1 Tax=Fomitopsis serialis TaxID=139415 RepID=UPI002008E1CF|nr:transmembrane amino acid transporter protein-domain-containing protein [Neoantrodia serialis]KAH9928701.1 transmembrane amino acid transporter protein-domain-containing protein [Neoantrodia serialis]
MSSPSKPVNIVSPRRANAEIAGVGTPPTARAVSGSPSPRALRAQYAGTPQPPNIPRRGTPIGTPSAAGSSPFLMPTPLAGGEPSSVASLGGISARRPDTPGSGIEGNALDDLTDEEKARILRRHLVSRQERDGPAGQSSRASVSGGSDNGVASKRSSFSHLHTQREESEPFPVPYHAPGADVTHNIYKWQADKRRQAARPRAASFAGSTRSTDPAFQHIHEPGGFRRNYLLMRRGEDGTADLPHVPRNFIEFLYLFGHFAGEDLEEIEEEDEYRWDDMEAQVGTPSSAERDLAGTAPLSIGLPPETSTDLHKASERSPLLPRSRSRRARSGSVGPHGDATVTQALLKSFVGTGILFLGKAFFNGGILFSSAVLTFIALISLYSFLLLVKTKFVVSGSFGDIGGTLYGPWMRYAILASITISQLGFVSAYIIFVSENLQAFVLAITNCAKLFGIQYFILLQMIIFMPLVLIRNLAKLSTTALVADVFILAGLIYIFGSEAAIMADRGHADVAFFNAKDWPLLIGTAVFSFEGIGLVIPITDAMKEPRKFPKVLTGVMLFLMVLFCGGGVMSYLTFGSDVQTVVIVNLDTTSKFTQVVQFLYSLAILLSVPLQLFPAVRIMENGLFERSGKADARVKWTKNCFRFVTIMFCCALSWAGANDLDKFVSFVGSFACVPLCYVYPAMLHFKACAHTRKQKVADIALMIFGIVAATYTTVQTVRLMVEPAPAVPPRLGSCDIPDGLFHGGN